MEIISTESCAIGWYNPVIALVRASVQLLPFIFEPISLIAPCSCFPHCRLLSIDEQTIVRSKPVPCRTFSFSKLIIHDDAYWKCPMKLERVQSVIGLWSAIVCSNTTCCGASAQLPQGHSKVTRILPCLFHPCIETHLSKCPPSRCYFGVLIFVKTECGQTVVRLNAITARRVDSKITGIISVCDP